MSLLYHFEQSGIYYKDSEFGLLEEEDWPQSFEFKYGCWDLIQEMASRITRYHKAFLVRRYTDAEKIDEKWIVSPAFISTFKDVPYWDDLDDEFYNCRDTGDFSSYPDDLVFFGENETSWFYFWLDQDVSDCSAAMINKVCFYPWDENQSFPCRTSLEEWIKEFLNPDVSYFEKNLPPSFLPF